WGTAISCGRGQSIRERRISGRRCKADRRRCRLCRSRRRSARPSSGRREQPASAPSAQSRTILLARCGASRYGSCFFSFCDADLGDIPVLPIAASIWRVNSSPKGLKIAAAAWSLGRSNAALLHALPNRVTGSRTDGWSRIGQGQFVAGKFEKSLLIDAPPVWEGTALNVIHNDFICLPRRVRTEVGNASVYGCLVLFWSSCLAIGGREFGNIRTNEHYGKSAVRGENRLALWIGAIHIALLVVLL